ncbi:hypothetical protein [Yinghuangia soli]|uniref:Uncharacterized protein n=1 Tax=Yinghuangia soli TaxID=2908204 RepID=A0AA41U5B6_9ACTN|nr:hypothetical protein [Yinghuangia soli]MCF2533866.1 hypothetical protein [Yinghuangia soli]
MSSPDTPHWYAPPHDGVDDWQAFDASPRAVVAAAEPEAADPVANHLRCAARLVAGFVPLSVVAALAPRTLRVHVAGPLPLSVVLMLAQAAVLVWALAAHARCPSGDHVTAHRGAGGDHSRPGDRRAR